MLTIHQKDGGAYRTAAMLPWCKLCTSQSPTCRPLPLLLRGKSFALPLAEGLSIVPANLHHWVFQALPDSWTWSRRLSSTECKEWKNGRWRHTQREALKNEKDLTCLQNTRSTGSHQGADFMGISENEKVIHKTAIQMLTRTQYVLLPINGVCIENTHIKDSTEGFS